MVKSKGRHHHRWDQRKPKAWSKKRPRYDGHIDDDDELSSSRQPKKQLKASNPTTNKPSGKKNRTWEESFQALKEYKEAKGNCNVPSKFANDRALGQWVEKIRRKAITVTPQQHERLTKLGFDWETLAEKIKREWNEKYDLLCIYYNQYGETRIPSKVSSKTPAEKIRWVNELGQWVATQRTFFRQGRLKGWHIRKLSRIGFEFTVRHNKAPADTTDMDLKWMDQYTKLTEFQKQNGHCMVTLSHKDQSLCLWVKTQRENYKRNLLRLDRMELLQEIDFCWNSDTANSQTSHNQRQWDKMFDLLKDYRREHGHVDVPRSATQDAALSSWLDHQKTYWRRGELGEGRVERLAAIGVTKGYHRRPSSPK